MMGGWRPSILAGVATLAVLAPLSATEDITVKLRMSKRLERVESLKLRGEIGENFDGCLETL